MKFKCQIIQLEDRTKISIGDTFDNDTPPIYTPRLHLNLVLETINEIEIKALKGILGKYIEIDTDLCTKKRDNL